MKKISIVLPVFNEEKVIEQNVDEIRNFLIQNLEHDFEIIIVDNGSKDSTLDKIKKICNRYSYVNYIHIDERGRGRALRKAWSENSSDIVSYMDIDLSTSLNAFPRLIKAIEDCYDIAIGSRFVKGSNIKRSFMRGFLSRGYNLLLKLFFNTSFSDAQCGFKAIRKSVLEEILDDVKDQKWFFDTELLIKAERKGFRIKEVPVNWTESRNSKVNILKTIVDYIKSIIRLRIEV